MANYFARVELHGAAWPDDYEDLHKRLSRIGFHRCISFTDGGSKVLPTGFYYAAGLGVNKDLVAKKVFAAAAATGYANEAVVVKSGGSNSSLSEECE